MNSLSFYPWPTEDQTRMDHSFSCKGQLNVVRKYTSNSSQNSTVAQYSHVCGPRSLVINRNPVSGDYS